MSHIWEKAWYLLNRRMGRPYRQPGHFGEEKNFLTFPEFKPWIVQPLGKSLLTDLSGLPQYCVVGDQILSEI